MHKNVKITQPLTALFPTQERIRRKREAQPRTAERIGLD